MIPPSDLSIVAYFHCRRCLEEMPPGTSPQDWSKLDVGWTRQGLQIWCHRHGINVLHIDFEGHQHPANSKGQEA